MDSGRALRLLPIRIPRENLMPVTIAAIAEAAGVSKATVSLALHRHPRITATTRGRVMATAERLGYRPHSLVSAHMTAVRAGHQPAANATICYVIPDAKDYMPRSAVLGYDHGKPILVRHTRRMRHLDATKLGYEGAQRSASEVGWNLKLAVLRNPRDDAAFVAGLDPKRIAGIILAPCYNRPVRLQLEWDRFATAVLEGFMPDHDFNRVRYDVHADIRDLFARVLDLGYSRCGFIIGKDTIERTYCVSLAGFLASQMDVRPELRIPPLVMHQWVAAEIWRWVRRYQPQVIIGHNFRAIQESLRCVGLNIPGDIAYAGIRNIPSLCNCSCCYEDYGDMGAAAFDLLHAHALHGEAASPLRPKSIMLRGRWNAGETLPPFGQRHRWPTLEGSRPT